MVGRTTTSRITNARYPTFRNGKLREANIGFGVLNAPQPAHVSELIAYLNHWPYPELNQYEDYKTFTARLARLTLADEEIAEVRVAADLANRVSSTEIHKLACGTDSAWLRLNSVLLSPLTQAAREDVGSLTISEDTPWSQGPNRACLGDPKPASAYGLAASQEQGSPLSAEALRALHVNQGLTYSPISAGSLIYPSVILEAGSNIEAIYYSENQLAVGAARALALLADLSSLSQVPFQHCVVLIAAQGDTWEFFVAFQDLDINEEVVSQGATDLHVLLLTPFQHIVRVLQTPRHTQCISHRAHIVYIVNRIKAWLLGPFRTKVCEQLNDILQQ